MTSVILCQHTDSCEITENTFYVMKTVSKGGMKWMTCHSKLTALGHQSDTIESSKCSIVTKSAIVMDVDLKGKPNYCLR